MRRTTSTFYKYAWLPLSSGITYSIYQGYQSYWYIYNMMHYTSENQGVNYSLPPRYISTTTLSYVRTTSSIFTSLLISYYSYKGFMKIFLAQKPSIHRIASISNHPIANPSLLSSSLSTPAALLSSSSPNSNSSSLSSILSLSKHYYIHTQNFMKQIWLMLGPQATSQSYRQFLRLYSSSITSLFLSLCCSITFTPIFIVYLENYIFYTTNNNTLDIIPWGAQRRKQHEQKRIQEEARKYTEQRRDLEMKEELNQLPSLFTSTSETEK